MADDGERYRIVFLGSGKVGKSSILHRFLKGTFSFTYKMTVEDLHPKDYNLSGTIVRVDFLDTAGDIEFPAMRRLSISTAHAFVLVYSVEQPASFDEVKNIWEQIKEQRKDYQDIPCVIVSNKADLDDGREVVDRDEVDDWAYKQGLDTALIETSAKLDNGIVNIFQKLLEKAKIPKVREMEPVLSRRLSAKDGRTAHKKPTDRLKESEGKLNRSRSLIRRATRPKVKQTDNMDSDCVIC